MEIARELGIEVTSRNFSKSDLYQADEIWISSALREVLPITRLDGQAVADGLPGPVWKKVYQAFQIAKRTH
jgi:D-alanine transaminase